MNSRITKPQAISSLQSAYQLILKSTRPLILILSHLLITSSIFAQSPQKMSYQAVIRDGSNALVQSQSVGMQISILQGSITGTAVYVETHSAVTNSNGLVSIEIGGGAVTSGSFATIDWANGPFFVKTETDPAGGTNYTITGTSQLLSVPYAMYAASSGSSIPGPAGPQGPQGPAGNDGAPGPQGPQGVQGLTGPQGPAGNDGAPGPQGPQGAQGLTGAAGPQGPAGATGAQGPQGPQGLTGPQGPAGNDGATGPQGPIGLTGPAGPQGATGLTGPQGPAGATGAQGPSGPQGAQGTGVTILGSFNSVGQLPSTGNAGDSYLVNGDLYVWSTNTLSWSNVGNIQGPAGVAGPQGPIGLTGATGPAGPVGLQGATGAQGPQGATGLTGAQGPQGPIGLTGPTGPQGATGLTGAQGPQGPAGANGSNGTNGKTVLNGTTNPTAIIGSNGDFYINTTTNFIFGPKAAGAWPTNGVSLVGPQGATGATGATGPQGPVGAAGATGPQGAIGLTGPAGPQGATGLTGAQGPQGPAGLLSNGTAAGNTPYWNGTSWVVNNSNLHNNGAGIGIGTSAPNASAKLEVASTSQGFLPPRMTTAQRNAINSPAVGLIIYNTTTNCLNFFVGSGWNESCGTSGSINALNCSSANNYGTLTSGTWGSVYSVVPYTGGNGGTHNGQTVASTGVTGLTATLAGGIFASGAGTLTYTITGTPSGSGTASFALIIGGQTCTLIFTVSSIYALYCDSATSSGTLTSGTAATGVSSLVPYACFFCDNSSTYTGQTVTSTGVTGLTATLAAGTFTNGGGNLTYTISGTPNASGTASFALNIGGLSCNLNLNVVSLASLYPANSVFCNGPTAIVEVTNPATGRIWMDRNLGATQVATSSNDANAYGDLYQWGRRSDGHQCRTSATTTTLSSTDQPANGSFILAPNSPFDWRSPQNTNLWQGVNGVNNPCPTGYRLPTDIELNTERTSWSSNNSSGAWTSPLKLPAAGYRFSSNGSLGGVGTDGLYWSNKVNGLGSSYLDITSGNAILQLIGYRASGTSVRCIKD